MAQLRPLQALRPNPYLNAETGSEITIVNKVSRVFRGTLTPKGAGRA